MSEQLTPEQIHEAVEDAFKLAFRRTTMCRTPECKYEGEHLRRTIHDLIEGQMVERKASSS